VVRHRPRYGFCAEAVDRAFAALVDDVSRHPVGAGQAALGREDAANIINIDYLFRLFPNAQFVHMIRDPRTPIVPSAIARCATGRIGPVHAPRRHAIGAPRSRRACDGARPGTISRSALRGLTRDPRDHAARPGVPERAWDVRVFGPKRMSSRRAAACPCSHSIARWRTGLSESEVATSSRRGELMVELVRARPIAPFSRTGRLRGERELANRCGWRSTHRTGWDSATGRTTLIGQSLLEQAPDSAVLLFGGLSGGTFSASKGNGLHKAAVHFKVDAGKCDRSRCSWGGRLRRLRATFCTGALRVFAPDLLLVDHIPWRPGRASPSLAALAREYPGAASCSVCGHLDPAGLSRGCGRTRGLEAVRTFTMPS